MSIKEQIEIVKLLRADMNELNGGYQTNVVMANKKADELINHLQQVKNNDLLHSVISCPKCENPYPHIHKDGSKSCDECGHTWG